jgi:hypothetical protein
MASTMDAATEADVLITVNTSGFGATLRRRKLSAVRVTNLQCLSKHWVHLPRQASIEIRTRFPKGGLLREAHMFVASIRKLPTTKKHADLKHECGNISRRRLTHDTHDPRREMVQNFVLDQSQELVGLKLLGAPRECPDALLDLRALRTKLRTSILDATPPECAEVLEDFISADLLLSLLDSRLRGHF